MIGKLIKLISITLVIAFIGCDSKLDNPIATYRLPEGSYNVMPLGNDWVRFDLVVDGVPFRFVYTYRGGRCIASLPLPLKKPGPPSTAPIK